MGTSKYFPRGRALESIGAIVEHRTSPDFSIRWVKRDPKVGRWYADTAAATPGHYLSSGQLMNRFVLRQGHGDTYTAEPAEDS